MANTTNRTTRIKHVFGNVLKLAIPLTLRTVTLEGGIVEVTDTDYTPSNHYPVVVQFVNGPLKYELDATIRDNYIAVVEDKGTIPVGNYAIVVLCKDDNGDPRRFKQRCVLEVVDVTADAGIEVGIEFEAQEWLLDGAIFLAIKGEDGIDGVGIESITTDETSVSGEYNQVTFHLTNGSSYTLNVRNGESTEQTLPANVVVDENYVHTDNNYTDTDKQKIESVDKLFADAEYDRISRRLNFFKHGDTMHTNPLKSIDITDFIRDSRVSSFRIVDGNLTIKLNSDGNNEEFKVPITSINANYYTKSQVDNKLIGLMAKEDFVYEGSVNLKYGSAPEIVLSHIEGVSMYQEDHSRLFGASNGHIKGYVGAVGGELFDYGLAPLGLVFLDKTSGLFYRWNVTAWQQVGGSGSGSGGYEPPIGGIPKTDLTPAVQASLDLADSALQSSDLDGYATTDDVDDAVSALVSSAPQTLDTLKELADALGDDPNFATTMATQLGNKVDKETGKGLSTNDYTTAEKTKLASIDPSTYATKTELNGKQDAINDLASIRINSGKGVADVSSNADGTVVTTLANGDTYTIDLNHEHPQYVESDDLADVATSGSYNDLTDKPVIPEGADLSGYYTKTEIDNKGFITTETDPTVPSWAKQSSKPTYTAQEVGALPASTTIPTKTSDLTNDSGFIDKAMYYGTSDTAATTMPKVCTVETFPTTTSGNVTHAKEGTIIAVKFTNSDTNTTDAPSLNVNGIGAKAIMYNNAIVTSTAKNTTVAGTAKMLAYYRYDPSLDEGNGAWEFLAKSVDSNSTYSNASLGQGYGTQTNSSAATAITSSISSYALSSGGIVTIKFTYDVPANATLNINSKGAKAIYNQGAAIAAGVIKAGDTATFIYSTYYHLIAVDSWQNKQDTISDLATIRSGAALGASALQSYTETDPTVPAWAKASTKPTYTAQEVGALPNTTTIPTDLGDLTNNAGYTKNTGTITGITMNGASKGTSGVVDLGTVVTDVSGKADAVTLENVASTGSVSQALNPNTFYKFGTVDSLTLSLVSGTGFVVYAGKFTTSSSWASSGLTLPSGVTNATCSDSVVAGKTYEFNILDNIIIVKEVA